LHPKVVDAVLEKRRREGVGGEGRWKPMKTMKTMKMMKMR